MTHWRRHGRKISDAGVGVEDEAINYPDNKPVCASACGRTVFVAATVSDPAEADCPECELVRDGLLMVATEV